MRWAAIGFVLLVACGGGQDPAPDAVTDTVATDTVPDATAEPGGDDATVVPDEGGPGDLPEDPTPAEVPDPGADVQADETASDPPPEVPDVPDVPEAPDIPIEYPSWLAEASCFAAPPEGSALAPPPPTYSGICPVLAPGFNTIVSSGKERRFLLVAPAEPVEGEVFPLLFMWHWLKSKPQSFLEKGDVQAAVDQQRFLAAIPESLYDIDFFGLVQMPWPFLSFLPSSRFQQEYQFFDDMLACIAAQYAVNKECVSTVGVSAGGLYTTLLASARSERLSSLLSLSGGAGGTNGIVNEFLVPWDLPARKLPAIVLWGGPMDSCVMVNFQESSQQLEKDLIANGEFFVECIHNCKHSEPPIDPPPGKSRYFTLWDFFLKHPYWLPAGWSPYLVNGMPPESVPWCAIGMGSATPRTGACEPPDCPI
jgi:hypothetical protein